jgi:anti-sigma B factor antagonist
VSDLVGLDIRQDVDVVIARLTGELDLSGTPRTSEAIAEAVPTSARGLVVDVTDLEFIDSSGVAMLFALTRQLESRRQELRVAASDGGPVSRVLDIVEFGRAAPIHHDAEEAVGAMTRGV